MKPPLRAAFLLVIELKPHPAHLENLSKKSYPGLFNTLVEKGVEKAGSIFVSGSPRDVSTPCTEMVAGTLVVS
jgi:hypothetical protein